MADNNITFKIGSKFSGEGFKQAQKAIEDNRKEIASSVRGLGELTSVLGNVSPHAATAVSAVKKFSSAFVAGGIVGGTIQLALTGISFAVEKTADCFKEAAEATRRYAEILKNNLLGSIESSASGFKRLQDEMSKSGSQARDLLAVLNGEVAHNAANKIYQIHVETINKITDNMTETEKAVILAEESRKVAIIKATAAEEQAANAIDAANTQLNASMKVKEAASERAAAADKALADLTEQCGEYVSKRRQVENYLATQEQRFADGQIGLQDVLVARKNANLKIQELEETYKSDVDALQKATADVAQAKQDAAKSDYDYVRAQDALRASVLKHDEAQQEIAVAELDGAEKVREAMKREVDARTKLAKTKDKEAAENDAFLNELKRIMDGVTSAEEDIEGSLEDWVKALDEEKKKKGKASAGATANASSSVVLPNVLNVRVTNWPDGFLSSDGKGVGTDDVKSYRENKREGRYSDAARRKTVSDIIGELGPEAGDLQRALGTDKQRRTEDQQRMIDYYNNTLIPSLVKKMSRDDANKIIDALNRPDINGGEIEHISKDDYNRLNSGSDAVSVLERIEKKMDNLGLS